MFSACVKSGVPAEAEPRSSADPSLNAKPVGATPREGDAAGSSILIKEVTVRVPDLFIDIMAAPYAPNPHLAQVKPEADAWTERVLKMDERAASRSRKINLVFLSASMVPRADAIGLRLLSDWNHWGFPWDDQFDEGPFQFNTIGGIQEIVDTLAVLDETHPHVSDVNESLKYALQTVWLQFKERTSPYMQDRLRRQLRAYALGCLEQTVWNTAGRTKRSVDEYMGYRRLSIGVYPVAIMSEAAMGLDLPRDVREHPAIMACEAAIVDIVTIHNDILSMRKEIEDGAEHNLVKWLLDLGLTPQEAMDKTGAMLDECFAQWHVNQAQIPSWGAEMDVRVKELLDIFRDLALGSLNWSFVSGRYFGEEGADVRRTRILTLKLPNKAQVKG